MMKKNKILMMALCSVLLLRPDFLSEAAQGEDNTLTYTVNAEGEAVITGGESTEKEINIPGVINGHPVAGIEEGAFQDRTDIAKASIQADIRYIGEAAFSGCTKLKEIILEDGMLESDSVKILKYNGNEEVVFIPERLEGKEVSVIGEAAFQSNGEIKQAVLPAGIVTIEERAFEGCSELQYVFLNEEVREIGYRAFGDCNSLEEITFPEGMTDIRAGICEECTGLKKIVLPKSMCFIDENAFSGCMELQLVYGESEFAEAFAEKEGKIYVDFGRIREEGNQVW